MIFKKHNSYSCFILDDSKLQTFFVWNIIYEEILPYNDFIILLIAVP